MISVLCIVNHCDADCDNHTVTGPLCLTMMSLGLVEFLVGLVWQPFQNHNRLELFFGLQMVLVTEICSTGYTPKLIELRIELWY